MSANLYYFVLFLPIHESSIHILVSVNNGRQVNLARINLRLEFRRNPVIPQHQFQPIQWIQHDLRIQLTPEDWLDQ